MIKSIRFFFLSFCILLAIAACSPTNNSMEPSTAKQILWPIDNVASIAGHPTEIMGNPEVIDNAVFFDGDGDRLLVDNNPLEGATEFTIEIVFKPNDAYPDNIEPRFFHIESEENPNRRITMELRLNARQQWYLDTYIKSDISKYTLIDETLIHPVGVWAHAAMTYKDRVFTAYVNGVKELSAEVDFLPIPSSAKTSIGARMNKIHWFNGAISNVAITHKAMQPGEFALLKRVKK
ncbi:MAG: LamG domain-containing protein [Gammaproteobacteria bacterium]|nr:LamG domain-containing protein [Gammaproteobacteria bacterium]